MEQSLLGELLAKLRLAATGGQRADALAYYARLCGVSVPTMRRRAIAGGFSFGYKTRRASSPANGDGFSARERAAEAVATLIVQSRGAMPTWVAVENARKLGMIPADVDLPRHYVDRYIRRHAIERSGSAAPHSARKCTWGDCGRVLQVDSTNCAQWFLPQEDGSIRFAAPGEVYHNKPPKRNGQDPIIRYVATDPTSGCFRVRYYQVSGESAETSLAFLYHVFSRSADPERMPMAGVPGGLVADNGPGNRSAAVANLAAALGMDLRFHLPHHPWAKGAVEKTMHVWQRVFESQLLSFPAGSIDELNERAFAANCEFCLTRTHSRTRVPRAVFYAENVAEVKLPPPWELFVEAATTAPQERTVGGGEGAMLISYEGRNYYCGALAGVKVGDKVLVAKAVLDWDEETRPVRISVRPDTTVATRDGSVATVIEHALTKTATGNFADARVYGERTDAALIEIDAARELRLAAPMPAAPPAVAMESLPRVAAPAARLVLRPAAPAATMGRTTALLKLMELLGRELNEFEIHGLGWSDAVTQEQVRTAAEMLRAAGSQGSRRAAAAG